MSLSVFVAGCSLHPPVSIIQKILETKIEYTDSLLTEHLIGPDLNINTWGNSYDEMHRSVPTEVKKTQMGLSFVDNGVENYFCRPSAFPHFYLDTLLSISNYSQDIFGNWSLIKYGSVQVSDSISISDSTINRNIEILDVVPDNALLQVFPNRYILFAKSPSEQKYKKVNSSSYYLLNGRYFMVYRFFKSGAATNFVGIDENGLLFWDNYGVNDSMKYGEYVIRRVTIFRMVFEKI